MAGSILICLTRQSKGASQMLEFKFRPLAPRAGQIQRLELLSRFHSTRDVPNLAITAPAGYGKTTLLSQMEEAEERRTAWLTIDVSDSDPATLLMSLANSLLIADLIDKRTLETLSTRYSDTVFTRGVNELWAGLDESAPGVLFLDQVDHLKTQGSLDVVGAVMSRHPESLQVVIASRSTDGLPLPLLRARAEIVELTLTDLALTTDETEALFDSQGVDISGHLDEVVRRTEGWPAATYLTALAIKTGATTEDALEVRGDDVLFADYLRQELLARTPEKTLDFMLRTSILEQLSGPLCDHIVEGNHSAETLSGLEEANLLIVPLDRTRTWYRYHSLLGDFLRSELERRHPAEVPQLHSRAVDWFDENGPAERAIEHAMAAGDVERFGEIVMSTARRVYAAGRVKTLNRWWSWLEDCGAAAEHPELAALAGFYRTLDGDVAGAEMLAAHVFNDAGGQHVQTDELGPFALLLRASNAARGVDQALADARAARALIPENSEWTHMCLGAEAQAIQAAEGLQAADALRAEGLRRGEAFDANPSTSRVLALRALVAIDRDDWETAQELIGRSMEIISQNGLEDYVTSALAFTLAARIEARKGNVDTARGYLASASALRPLLTVAVPLASVPDLHELARAFIEVGDVAGARRVMREASDIIAVRPNLGTHIANHSALKEQLSDLPAGSVGASSLTKAELRLLPLLVTHLTYPEIGDRLHVSRHTVKTQAISIYRKLGVSSRSDAVSKAREIGLISL